jgi:hypothetical protein
MSAPLTVRIRDCEAAFSAPVLALLSSTPQDPKDAERDLLRLLFDWRPDRVGHEALMGVNRGVAPGLWQGSAACNRTMRILTNAILESTSKKKNAKMAL